MDMKYQDKKIFRLKKNRIELLSEDEDVEILAVVIRTLLYINLKQSSGFEISIG